MQAVRAGPVTVRLSRALYPPGTSGPAQVLRFFDGLELVEPGVVPIHQWHPGPGTVDPPAVPALGGIGRKA